MSEAVELDAFGHLLTAAGVGSGTDRGEAGDRFAVQTPEGGGYGGVVGR